MNRKGICYDVGRVMYGNWRPDYDPKIVHREMEIINVTIGRKIPKIIG